VAVAGIQSLSWMMIEIEYKVLKIHIYEEEDEKDG
jgi:hypothetical protein